MITKLQTIQNTVNEIEAFPKCDVCLKVWGEGWWCFEIFIGTKLVLYTHTSCFQWFVTAYGADTYAKECDYLKGLLNTLCCSWSGPRTLTVLQ